MKRVQHTQILSILLAVCMLVSLLSAGMMAGALDADVYNDGNAYYRYNMHIIPTWYRSGYGSQTKYLALSEYSASIWQMAEGHSAYTPHYDSLYPGFAAAYERDYLTDTTAADDFLSKDPADFATDPWMLAGYNPSAVPAPSAGAGLVVSNPDAYITLRVLVPSTGTYTPRVHFYAYGSHASSVNMYLAPIDADDVRDEGYLVGTFTGTNAVPATAISSSAYDALYTLADPITLDAGEYVVTYHSVDGKFFYGGSLTLRKAEALNDLVLTADAAALNVDGQLEAPIADAVSIDISAANNDGAVDLASIEPEYVRIDCGSDAISAIYQDGVVTVVANRLDVDPVTNLTLLFVGGDAAAWVEVPVKVVPGKERSLTLNHAGPTDTLLATVQATLEISALIDNESAAIASTDSVAVEIVDASGNAATAETAIRIADGKAYLDLKIPTAGSYTAKVSATIDGVALASVYEISLTVSEIGYYYNYMKLKNVVTAGGGAYGWQFQEFMDDYADTWKGGSTDIAPANVSDGWFPGEHENAGPWRWTSSAASLGAYFLETAIGGYNSVNLYLPIGGNYTVSSVHTPWSGGGNLDYYLAPKGTANPFAAEYKLNTEPVNHNGDGSVVYGDAFCVRSIYEVAKNGIASGTATATDLEVFQTIVETVEGAAESSGIKE